MQVKHHASTGEDNTLHLSNIKSMIHRGTGFNELRFEDKKGQEKIFTQAQKDFRRRVKNDEEAEAGTENPHRS